MFKALKLIFRVHREPKAIITSLYPPLLRVMTNLETLGIFQGLHLIDKEAILENVRTDLKDLEGRLPEKVKAEVLDLCRRITVQTN